MIASRACANPLSRRLMDLRKRRRRPLPSYRTPTRPAAERLSHRLQVLISPELDAQLRKAAQRSRLSKGEWVRRVLQESVCKSAKGRAISDPLARLECLGAP